MTGQASRLARLIRLRQSQAMQAKLELTAARQQLARADDASTSQRAQLASAVDVAARWSSPGETFQPALARLAFQHAQHLQANLQAQQVRQAAANAAFQAALSCTCQARTRLQLAQTLQARRRKAQLSARERRLQQQIEDWWLGRKATAPMKMEAR